MSTVTQLRDVPSGESRRHLTRRAFAAAATAKSRRERRAALDQVVIANLGVARSLAARHRGKGIDQDDLEQVAYTALVLAARRFEPARTDDFLSFAVPTIRGELKRHFRDQGWVVRPPRRLQEVQMQALTARVTLSGQLGRSPRCSEIAEYLDVPVAEVEEALALDGAFRPTSLEVPAVPGTPALGERLEHRDDHGPLEARHILAPVLKRLQERDRKVVELSFWGGLTQVEIAEAIGLTQSQVSRILSRACAELREALGDEENRTPPRRSPVQEVRRAVAVAS